MSAAPGVRVEVDGAVGRIALDDPDRRNPLGAAVLQGLVDAAARVDAAGCRVVVVSGEGPSFSGGFDVREFDRDDGDLEATATLGATMADAIEGISAVTIAAVHGHCVGGGVVLTSACDLRIAADDTTFRIPEVELGIPLAWGGIPRLVRDIGPVMTRELVLTCRAFDAAEAQRMGFVNRVVPAVELDGAVEALVGNLLDKPGGPIRTTVAQVRRAAHDLVPPNADTDLLVAALREALAARDG